MNVAEINTVNYGSTGKIMLGIQKVAKDKDINVFTFYALGNCNADDPSSIRVGHPFFNKISSKLAHITGLMGFFSPFSTMKLISQLKKYKIDIIHLHNIHVSFLNYAMLFRFIKTNDIKVVWTLHDCWSFTGHCPHFSYPKCDKWKTQCFECPRYREYPISSIDNSRYMFFLKKRMFSGIKNMTIVTPSNWLKQLVKESFLSEYPVQVINNGIDISHFYPLSSNFREKYSIGNKFMVLGVAFDWSDKKGLDVFVELSRRLNNHEYQFVLVGTDANIDKVLPREFISIHKTESIEDLAQIYSSADVLLNPTREEVLGLVNIEANACGTPVLMFNTGGSPECISEKSGYVVNVDDIDTMEMKIKELAKSNIFKSEDCIRQAQKFDMNLKYNEYISLYEKLFFAKQD